MKTKDLISDLEQLKIEGSAGDNVPMSEPVDVPMSTRDQNIFIPNEYAYWGGASPGTYTISSSSMSSRSTSHTTDSKKEHN